MLELKLTEIDYCQMIQCEDGRITTTSLKVAECFGKPHGKVLRDIRKLTCSEGFRQANFGSSFYLNEQGKKQPMFTMTRDGWMFLVMGFTGEKAGAWKEAFIAAFNWIASELARRNYSYEQMRNELLFELKQEKSVASLAGKTLKRWQLKKPEIEGRILAVEHEGQHQLQLH